MLGTRNGLLARRRGAGPIAALRGVSGRPLRRSVLGTVAAACASLLVLSGCGGGGSAKSATSGGNLVMAHSSDSTTMLPSTTTQNADIWTSQQVYETLTLNKPDGSGVEPGLATDWKQSKDGLHWTFNLRHGVKFHSGKKMDADDVVFSLNYARDQKDDQNQWAAEFQLIKDVKKVDDYTVRIDLSKRWLPLPSYLALFASAIYPKNFGGHSKKYMSTHEDGTGAFKLDKWTKGQSLRLVKNPDYWKKGVPKLDSVTFNVVAEDNTRMLQLQGGQVDLDEAPPSLSMDTLGRSNDVKASQFESTRVDYIQLNTKKPGMDDPKVRRAMSYAINRKAVTNVVYGGYAKVANSYISPGLAGHSDKVNGGEYSMSKARKLMKESKHPKGVDIEMQILTGDQEAEMMAQIAQQSWADIGVKVKISKIDDSTKVSNRNDGKYDSMVGYATSDVTDTSQMIAFMGITDGSGIHTNYGNPQVKKWYSKALAQTNEKKRNVLYAKIQQKVADDAPLIPLVYRPSLYGVSKKVVGYRPYVLGTYGLKEARIKH